MYCLTTELTGAEKPEHVVPASIGASLTVMTACDACNEWAGREIDQPFLDDLLLREARSQADQRDPRRGRRARRVRSRLLTGHTADGDRVTYDHEQGRPVMGSRIVDLGGGRTQVRAGSEEEAQRLLEVVRKRAAEEGKEAKVESTERRQVRPKIESTVSMRVDVWRREAAKMALALGSIVYPGEWRLSADAERLREWMHNRDRTTADGKAPPLLPAVVQHPFALGDEHLLWFMELGGDTYLSFLLFGTLMCAVPVDTTGARVPIRAWHLDWRAPRRDGETTFDDLVMAAVQQSMQAVGD